MKITIINGDDGKGKIRYFLSKYVDHLETENEVILHNLRELEIQPCFGCCSCCYKTPGVCKIKDDQQAILKDFISSDVVIIISNLQVGFINEKTKMFIDRLFPLELPYMEIKHGEYSHKLRYDHYPKIGFILETEPDSDKEDLEINASINADIGNFYGGFLFQRDINDSLEVLINETTSF